MLADEDIIVPFNPDARSKKFTLFRVCPGGYEQHPDGESWHCEIDPVFLAHHASWYHDLKIPQDLDENILRDVMGLIKLKPGVPVFARNILGSCEAKDDVLVAYQEKGSTVEADYPDHVAKVKKLRDEILGPIDERDGSIKGGTAFERYASRAARNRQGARCYTMGISYEKFRGIVHPAANLRAADPEDPEDEEQLRIRTELDYVNDAVY